MKNETNPLSEGVLSVNSIEPGMGKKINLKIHLFKKRQNLLLNDIPSLLSPRETKKPLLFKKFTPLKPTPFQKFHLYMMNYQKKIDKKIEIFKNKQKIQLFLQNDSSQKQIFPTINLNSTDNKQKTSLKKGNHSRKIITNQEYMTLNKNAFKIIQNSCNHNFSYMLTNINRNN